MATFKFKLDPVLLQRRAEEDKCQRRLAQSLRQRMILRDQLTLMQQTITHSKGQLSGGLVGQVDVAGVMQFARYSGQVTQRAHSFVTRLSGLEKQIDVARRRLLDAVRGRKALELLRDRRYQQWRHGVDRREDAMQDEMALQGYARRVRFQEDNS